MRKEERDDEAVIRAGALISTVHLTPRDPQQLRVSFMKNELLDQGLVLEVKVEIENHGDRPFFHVRSVGLLQLTRPTPPQPPDEAGAAYSIIRGGAPLAIAPMTIQPDSAPFSSQPHSEWFIAHDLGVDDRLWYPELHLRTELRPFRPYIPPPEKMPSYEHFTGELALVMRYRDSRGKRWQRVGGADPTPLTRKQDDDDEHVDWPDGSVVVWPCPVNNWEPLA